MKAEWKTRNSRTAKPKPRAARAVRRAGREPMAMAGLRHEY
jgi:hypothetical protein